MVKLVLIVTIFDCIFEGIYLDEWFGFIIENILND